jgi:hypothetical protein
MFNSVPFNEIVKWLGIGQPAKRVPTLGRRSYIDASAPNSKTIHIVGKNGGQADLDRAYWDYVCEVIDRTAPDRRHITTNYSQLQNYRFSPSVPALCRAYCEEKGGAQ